MAAKKTPYVKSDCIKTTYRHQLPDVRPGDEDIRGPKELSCLVLRDPHVHCLVTLRPDNFMVDPFANRHHLYGYSAMTERGHEEELHHGIAHAFWCPHTIPQILD